MLLYISKIILFQIIITYSILKLSKNLKLFDYPNKRKKHQFPTPYTGGLILSFTFLFIVFTTNFNNDFINLTLSFSFIICIFGLLDDKYNLNPGSKIIFQTIPIFFLVDQNLYLKDLGAYFFLDYIILGSFSKIFTVISCVFFINAANYSDGIDGLLTSISITILSSFILLIYLTKGFSSELEYILIIVPTLLFFLFFNFTTKKKYKIFLGNSGSNSLGFVIAFISIYMHNSLNIHPALIIWPLSYLVYEFLSVNVLRLFYKKNIFIPGEDHFHYEIQKYFRLKKKLYSFLIILTLNLFLTLIGFLIYFYTIPDLSIIVFIILFYFYLLFKIKIRKKIKNF